MKTSLPFLLFLLTLLACGGNDATTEPAPDPAEVAAPNPAPAAAPASALPSIDISRLEHLWENATYMDATFYDHPISINQSSLEQIRATIATIATEPLPVPAGAKPLGRIWFQVNGKNVEEAEIYFQRDAVGYVWFENGQPAYSNKMTREGVQFYDNILQSVPQ